MTFDLTKLSVAQIHERFVHQGNLCTAQVLAEMQRDSRAGVQKICRHLKRRQEKSRQEKRRIESMLHFERLLWESGAGHVAGVDEVGVGPLAGPVVGAAVIYPPDVFIPRINDSKKLTPQVRGELAQVIRRRALGIGVGQAEVAEIDDLNVYHAAVLAMRRAVEKLPLQPDHLLLDARKIPDLPVPQSSFSKGDALSFSIASASIIAKTHRDRLMVELGAEYPQYGFGQHKGYSTPGHQEAIRKHGPSPVHRSSYTFIEELCGHYSLLFYRLKEKLSELDSVGALTVLEQEFESVRGKLSTHERRKVRLLLTRRWASLNV